MTDDAPLVTSGNAGFFAGGGEMAALMRAKDWAQTPIGPIESWSQSLKALVKTLLASQYPMVLTWGPEFTQLYNDAYSKLIGNRHPAALGIDIRITLAESWDILGPMIEQVMRSGVANWTPALPLLMERSGYTEEAYFSVSHAPAEDDEGKIVGMLAVCSEVTQQVLAERRTPLLRSLVVHAEGAEIPSVEAVCREVVTAIGQHPLDVPFAGLYLREADKRTLALHGQTGLGNDQEVLPASLETASRSDSWGLARAAAASGETVHITDVDAHVQVTGGLFGGVVCSALALPLTAGGAPPLGVLLVGVSPSRELDEGYWSFYELLAAQVSTAIRNVRAYEEERKRAEALAEIDRAKTTFFSNVSHEFRTPLTLMLAPVEDALADAEGLPALQRERLHVAHRNALRLLKLVNSLLDFSRIEAGRAQASFEPTDLSALTADLASNFRSAIERAGLGLVVDCPPLPEPVYIDRDMWEKIVLNLLSNAFKFTHEGSIAVSLHAVGRSIELVVHDTGVGIPAQELPRVFERFHRIEGQHGRTHEGTGIGLALVEELVKLHGGAIRVDSSLDHGAAFSVTIPLGRAHLPADRVEGARTLASTAVQAGAYVAEALRWLPDRIEPGRESVEPMGGLAAIEGQPRIILADDNADMRAYVTRILTEGGYEVQAVENGAAALAAARRGPPPDLVLTDVMMPELDGFGLLRELRADPAMEGLLVVLLSARAGEEARVEGLAAGADDYLVKPFSARELRARIDGAVTLSRQRREAAARERDLMAELVTERGRAALRLSEARLRVALEAGRLGAWELDLATGIATRSPQHDRIFGYEPPLLEWSYDIFLGHVRPEDRAAVDSGFRAAIDARGEWHFECRIIRPDGQERWIEGRGGPAPTVDGAVCSLVGVVNDITGRKQHEQEQRLLLDELNHRVKNSLATVQSIAMQTRRNAQTPTAFGEALEGRIAALARAHDLLTEASWAGASLSEVVGQTLTPYLTNGDGERRVAMAGPPVRLGPNAAVTLNMAFHELATNAAKYGALSNGEGRVDVNWTVDRSVEPKMIEIVWTESGGPDVDAPSRRGFGSRLIAQGLARELDGDIRLDFGQNGVSCRMRLPASGKLEASA